MFTDINVKTLRQGKYEFYRIQVKGFDFQKSVTNISLEDFLKSANDKYFEKFGEEANRYTKKRQNNSISEYERIIKNRWASINQRSVNGAYANEPSVQATPQHISYKKRNIMLEMTKEEFYAWMYSVEHIHNEIVARGDKSSIDRIDSNRGYSLDNIRMVALHKNIEDRIGKPCKYVEESMKKEIGDRNRKKYCRNQVLGGN